MKIVFPAYVLKRMIERDISVAEVRAALESGEIIEEYLADAPPRYLVLGWITSRPLHVVVEFGVNVEVAAPFGDFVGEFRDAVDDGHGALCLPGTTGVNRACPPAPDLPLRPR